MQTSAVLFGRAGGEVASAHQQGRRRGRTTDEATADRRGRGPGRHRALAGRRVQQTAADARAWRRGLKRIKSVLAQRRGSRAR